MEEPGRRQSVGLKRVGHDWATSLADTPESVEEREKKKADLDIKEAGS